MEAVLHLNLERFSGPLDLLVYLIKARDLDILEVPILEICEQYLRYLEAFEILDLNQAAAYLAMAAELLALKTRILLQKELQWTEAEIEEQESVQAFRQKLLDYEALQEAREILERQFETRASFPIRVQRSERISGEVVLPLPAQDAYDLVFALERVLLCWLRRVDVPLQLRRRASSVSQIKEEILKRLPLQGSQSLRELLLSLGGLQAYILGFLSVLELVRLQKLQIRLEQGESRVAVFSGGGPRSEESEPHAWSSP